MCSYRFILCVALSSALGCTVPVAKPYASGPEKSLQGAQYCADLAEKGSDLSVGEAGGGWITAGAALGMIAAGGIISTANATRDDKSEALGITGTALSAGGALMVPLALAFFSRSDAAATLASQGQKGLATADDLERYKKCVEARALWDDSRSEATKYATSLLAKAQAEADEAKKKASEAKQEADEAQNSVKDKEAALQKEKEDAVNSAKEETQRQQAQRTEELRKRLGKLKEQISQSKDLKETQKKQLLDELDKLREIEPKGEAEKK